MLGTAGDIAAFLKEKVAKIWDGTCPGEEFRQFLDMDTHEFSDTQDLQNLTAASRVFVLILTHDRTAAAELKAGVAMRWFVVADELMTAVKMDMPILMIRDTDERPGRFGGSVKMFQRLFAESPVVAEVMAMCTQLDVDVSSTTGPGRTCECSSEGSLSYGGSIRRMAVSRMPLY